MSCKMSQSSLDGHPVFCDIVSLYTIQSGSPCKQCPSGWCTLCCSPAVHQSHWYLLSITIQSGRFGSARLDGDHYTYTHRESGATKTLMETKPVWKHNFFKFIIEANVVLKVLSKKYPYLLFLYLGIQWWVWWFLLPESAPLATLNLKVEELQTATRVSRAG